MTTHLPARIALAAAALLAMATFTGLQPDRGAAVESGVLTLLAAGVLAAVALLPREGWLGMAIGATASVALLVAVPAGPSRGAALAVVLVLAWLWEGFLAPGAENDPFGFGTAVALALALQWVVRSELLIGPLLEPRALVVLFALPVAGGLATAVLAARYGPPAVVATGLLVALAPGFRVAPTLALAALAGVVLVAGGRESRLARSQAAAPGGRPRDTGPTATEPGGRDTAAAAISETATGQWIGIGAVVAITMLGAATLWRPVFAPILVTVLGLAWARGGRKAALVVAGLGAGGLLLPGAPHGVTEVAAGLPWLLLLAPALPFCRPDRRLAVAALALLAAGALRWLPVAEALPAPLALAACWLVPSGAVFRLQRLWTAVVVAGSAVLAAYPWLRTGPPEELLERFALSPAWLPALTLTAAVAGLAGIAGELARRRAALPRFETIAVAGLAAAAIAALPGPAERPLGGGVLLLDAATPRWEAELSGDASAGQMVIDSHLSYGHLLARGTPVARIRLESEGDRREWTLSAGGDTGEWAARRPDVAASGVAAPTAWISWIAPERFFAQRYRAVRPIDPPATPHRIVIELASGLPSQTTLALYHLELRSPIR